jgi:uracil permease
VKNLFNNAYYGLLHTLVAFTSIVVVSRIVGFNLANSFLFVGIGTLILHLFTKNKIASLMGISGSYIGGMIYVTKTFGIEYTLGGVIVSGIIYVIFGLLMLKWQDKILKYMPNWLLSVAVMLIGLTLIPIGVSMTSTNMSVGLIALTVTALISLFGNKKINMFAIPIGILVATVFKLSIFGLDTSVLNQTFTYQFFIPKFNLASLTAVGIIGLPVIFELLGDTKNTSSCMNKDLFKEVGVGKIALGNGLGSIISGLGGSLPVTSYSENNGFLLLSGYTNPNAQIFSSIFFILLSVATPLIKYAMLIPSEVLGGIALYLYALITINSIKDLAETSILSYKREFTIITVMVAMFFLPFAINGIVISSVATSVIVGLILNLIIPKKHR